MIRERSRSSKEETNIHIERNEKKSIRPNVMGFTNPLTLSWFFSVTGAEYCHTYFWIIKDLAWMQSWRKFSILFGLSALAWSGLIFYHSIRTLNWHEVWNFIALFLWLFANFWWMIGEAHDYEFPYEPPVSAAHADSSARVLEVALIWVCLYYLIILPFNLLPVSRASLSEYDDGTFTPRFACFHNFRQYENLHMLFWIAKDLAWNRLQLTMWVLCVIPTVLLALDFIYISLSTPIDDSAVDMIHFTSVLLWVMGNSFWAYGDFFFDQRSEPMALLSSASIGLQSARWCSSWMLFFAIIPILVMYAIWITLTCQGKLRSQDIPSTTAFVKEMFPIDTSSTDSLLNENIEFDSRALIIEER